jgi:hypothetical protein
MDIRPKAPVDSSPLLWLVICVLLLSASLLPGSPNRQIAVFPRDKSVVDMTVEELLNYYPSELRRVQFAQNQDELSSLLEKVRERVRSFFQDLSNTSSKESIVIHKPGSWGIKREFNYLISYREKDGKLLVQEYRTDKKNQPVVQNTKLEYLITSGYVGLTLNFHPDYKEASRFRYLGRQTSDPRAYLLAFAQKLEAKDLQIEYTDINTGKSVLLPVQGIVWVDPETYQMMRLRINLLYSGKHSFITEQKTDLKLGEVRFEGTQKCLWLPREVVVETKIGGQVYRNQHRYKGYKAFDVSTDFTIDYPKPQN